MQHSGLAVTAMLHPTELNLVINDTNFISGNEN